MICRFVKRLFLSPTAHSSIVAYLRHNAHIYARSLSVLLSPFIHSFLVFFSVGCDPQTYTVGGRTVSTSVTAQPVICTIIDF